MLRHTNGGKTNSNMHCILSLRNGYASIVVGLKTQFPNPFYPGCVCVCVSFCGCLKIQLRIVES